MSEQTLNIECLTYAQALETYWAYCSQSNGELYNVECRETAMHFVKVSDELMNLDPGFRDALVTGLIDWRGTANVNDIFTRLKIWAEGTTSFPYEGGYAQSKHMLWPLLSTIKLYLLKKLEVENKPVMNVNAEEEMHSAITVRWKPHVSKQLLQAISANPGIISGTGSEKQTISVVADIRRSQDLMTYASNAKDFSRRMVHFISQTRALIDDNTGFFDKFTGDGFIVYFNEAICETVRKDYKDCFLRFSRDLLNFSQPFFAEWSQTIRKRPDEKIGLAVGADLGIVSFDDIQNTLVAVGDSVVWATRMATAAKGGQIMINNLLHAALEHRDDLLLEECKGQTKSGEGFCAHSMTWK